jgi:hypothetical protein
MFGPAGTMQIYRDGSKAVIDLTNPPAGPGGKPSRVRTIYDLQAHTNKNWDPGDPNATCGDGTFSGDWGDPLAMTAEVSSEMAKQKSASTGTETVNGFSASVFEFPLSDGSGKAKVWIEPKYGLVVRLQMGKGGTELRTIFETRQAIFAKPPASVFALPAACSAPHVDPDAVRIAAETGEPASNFSDATRGTASKDSCTVLFRVVRAGSMAAVTAGFQLMMDQKAAQLQNGVLRIDNAPPQFNLDVRVSNGGGEATIYRQCAGPQTTLLMVVKGLDKLGEGVDWLWVKSGKFAAR